MSARRYLWFLLLCIFTRLDAAAQTEGGPGDGFDHAPVLSQSLQDGITFQSLYTGGSGDGYNHSSVLSESLQNGNTFQSLNTGGSGDGYNHSPMLSESLQNGSAFQSLYAGGGGDGYHHSPVLSESLQNGSTFQSLYAGGSGDGYNHSPMLSESLQNGSTFQSLYTGGSGDGYNHSAVLSEPLQNGSFLQSLYTGGSGDGYYHSPVLSESLQNGSIFESIYTGGRGDGYSQSLVEGEQLAGNAPFIVQQPANVIVAQGGTAVFQISAIGTSPLSYQWYSQTSALGGQDSTLTIAGVTLAENESYFYAVVTNDFGSDTSSIATLTVAVPTPDYSRTVISTSETNLTAMSLGSSAGNAQLIINNGAQYESSSVILGLNGTTNNSIIVDGSNTVWSSFGNAIIGETGSGNQFYITNGGTVDIAGNLIVGDDPSSTNNLVQIDDGTLIVTNSAGTGTLVINGGDFVFDSGTVIVNQLIITNAAGNFTFNGGLLKVTSSVVNNGVVFTIGDGVSNAIVNLTGGTNIFVNGIDVSSMATLSGNGTVVSPTGITIYGTVSPGNSPGHLALNSNVNLLGTAYMEIDKTSDTNDTITGVGQLNYGGTLQISLLNGTTLAAGDQFQLFSAANYTGTFSKILPTNPGSGLVWNLNTLYSSGLLSVATAGSKPGIARQPSSQTLPIGDSANLTVSATGALPLYYQWYLNSNALAGATNPSLSIGPALTNDDGSYQVVVSNLFGSATSAVASLTVLVEPNIAGISNNPSGRSTTLSLASYPGSTNYLYATTNLALPLWQWQLIATNVAGINGLFQFTDTNIVNVTTRFYRLSDQEIIFIANVSPIVAEQYQTINISGTGFGTQSPYNGDSDYIYVLDNGRFEAGSLQAGNYVYLDVTSWTDSQIVISGFTGYYGYSDWFLDPGDPIVIAVWNPQTDAGPATYSLTVGSP